MIVTSDFLAGLLINYQTRFGAAWNDPANLDFLLALATRYDSASLTETVPFVGAVSDGPQDVTSGTVAFKDMSQYSYSLTNKTWQDGFQIQREAFADDRFRLYANAPASLLASHKLHLGEQAGDLFELGTDSTLGLAYDGLTFFHDTRTIGSSGTIDNLIGSGSGLDTAAHFMTDLAAAQALMMAFKNDKGRFMGLRGNTIVVPVGKYELVYQALATNTYISTGADMAAPTELTCKVGPYTLIGNPRLTDATDWYLVHVNPARAFTPFVWFDREPARLEGTTSVDSFEYRVERRSLYTTYARYVFGYGEPRTCVKIVNS